VAIGVQGLRDPIGLAHPVQYLYVAHGVLFLAEYSSQNLAGSVIQESDQREAEALIFQPDVGASVHLHQLALSFRRDPTDTMRLDTVLPGCCLLQLAADAPHTGIREIDVVLLLENVPDVARVVLTVLAQHQVLDTLANSVGYPPRRRLPAIAVEQTCRSFQSPGADVPSELAL